MDSLNVSYYIFNSKNSYFRLINCIKLSFESELAINSNISICIAHKNETENYPNIEHIESISAWRMGQCKRCIIDIYRNTRHI